MLAACGGGGGGGGGSIPGGGGAPTTSSPPSSGPTTSPTGAPTTSPSIEVTITFATQPQAVATQLGPSGAWGAVTLSGSTLTLLVPVATSNAYGVAYVCPANNGTTQEYIIEATTLDATSFTASCASTAVTQSGTAVDIQGTYDVEAITSANGFKLDQGNGPINGLFSGTVGTYTGVATAGTDDFVALAMDGFDVAGALVLRGQSVTSGATIDIPTFTADDASTTESISFPSDPDQLPEIATVTYVTAGGTRAVISDPDTFNSYGSIPSSQYESGDYYDGAFYRWKVTTTSGTDYVIWEQIFTSAVPLTANVPGTPSFGSVTAGALPSFTYDNADLASAGNVYDTAVLSWGTTPTASSISVFVSANWLDGETSYTLGNLSGLSGFLIPSSGESVGAQTSSNAVTCALSDVMSGLVVDVAGTGVDEVQLPVGATRETIANGDVNYTASSLGRGSAQTRHHGT